MQVMKRLLFVFVLILCGYAGMAQEPRHALGLRLDGGDGFGPAISFQYMMSDYNRVELDLGTNTAYTHNSWGLAGIFQRVWVIDRGFNWYAGLGGRVGSWNWDKNNYTGTEAGGTFVAAVANLGIEYTFPIKIQISIDARPELGLVNHGGDSYTNSIALSVRYRF